MRFEVKISRRAMREFGSLDQVTQKRVLLGFDELAENPFPRDVVKL
ncbi:MAG TPA: hypothetical protein VLY21_07800 [Nitrososphaerales archaeon]|nr:hypothetical protein [Nitrososphaerales archaeon]